MRSGASTPKQTHTHTHTHKKKMTTTAPLKPENAQGKAWQSKARQETDACKRTLVEQLGVDGAGRVCTNGWQGDKRVCECSNQHTHTHMHTRTHVHTHMHTHKHTCADAHMLTCGGHAAGSNKGCRASSAHGTSKAGCVAKKEHNQQASKQTTTRCVGAKGLTRLTQQAHLLLHSVHTQSTLTTNSPHSPHSQTHQTASSRGSWGLMSRKQKKVEMNQLGVRDSKKRSQKHQQQQT